MVNKIANEAAYLRFPGAGTLGNTEILSKYEKKNAKKIKLRIYSVSSFSLLELPEVI